MENDPSIDDDVIETVEHDLNFFIDAHANADLGK
jgi:hypothetical protein